MGYQFGEAHCMLGHKLVVIPSFPNNNVHQRQGQCRVRPRPQQQGGASRLHAVP